MTLFAIAWRNLSRNRRRSFLTASSVFWCVAFLILGMSWLQGILVSVAKDLVASTGPLRITTVEYAKKERLMPLYLAVPDLSKVLRELDGSVSGGIFPRISFGGLLINEADRSAPGLGRGILRKDGTEHFRLPDRMVAGKMFQQGQDEIVVGKVLADDLDLQPGDRVTILTHGATDSVAAGNFTVAGVFEAKARLLNRFYYIPLERAQQILDMEDMATEISLFGAEIEYTADPPAAVETLLDSRSDLTFSHWLSSGPLSAVFRLVNVLIRGIAGIVMFVAAIGVLNTMMMAVMERRRELGLLLAQGAPPWFLVAMILLEAIFLGAMGGLLGTVAGSVGGYWFEIHGIALGEAATRNLPVPIADTIHGNMTMGVALTGFIMGLMVSLLGAILPAYRAIRITPSQAMRVDA